MAGWLAGLDLNSSSELLRGWPPWPGKGSAACILHPQPLGNRSCSPDCTHIHPQPPLSCPPPCPPRTLPPPSPAMQFTLNPRRPGHISTPTPTPPPTHTQTPQHTGTTHTDPPESCCCSRCLARICCRRRRRSSISRSSSSSSAPSSAAATRFWNSSSSWPRGKGKGKGGEARGGAEGCGGGRGWQEGWGAGVTGVWRRSGKRRLGARPREGEEMRRGPQPVWRLCTHQAQGPRQRKENPRCPARASGPNTYPAPTTHPPPPPRVGAPPRGRPAPGCRCGPSCAAPCSGSCSGCAAAPARRGRRASGGGRRRRHRRPAAASPPPAASRRRRRRAAGPAPPARARAPCGTRKQRQTAGYGVRRAGRLLHSICSVHSTAWGWLQRGAPNRLSCSCLSPAAPAPPTRPALPSPKSATQPCTSSHSQPRPRSTGYLLADRHSAALPAGGGPPVVRPGRQLPRPVAQLSLSLTV